MNRKKPVLKKALEVSRDRVAVRSELRALLKNLEAERLYHVQRWVEYEGHPDPCQTCHEYESEAVGIRRAICHFGGRF
jgi:hypothetical protein